MLAMNRFLHLSILFLFLQNSAIAQHGYLIGENIAVFYPADFDSAGNLPSMALINEPVITGDVLSTWAIRPEYYTANGKRSARIAYDSNTDLYGTGEGVGSIRRNGADLILWNTDNF